MKKKTPFPFVRGLIVGILLSAVVWFFFKPDTDSLEKQIVELKENAFVVVNPWPRGNCPDNYERAFETLYDCERLGKLKRKPVKITVEQKQFTYLGKNESKSEVSNYNQWYCKVGDEEVKTEDLKKLLEYGEMLK